jgi:uncharacterized protein (DUF2461 family)
MISIHREANMTSQKSQSSSFGGFSTDLLEYLRSLARNNNKGWFDAHRADYDALYLEPAKQFAAALRTAVDRVRKAGYELNEPAYKRVPPGCDAEHRNAEYLRHKGLYAHSEMKAPAAILSNDAVAFVIEHFVQMKPIPSWLARAFAR